jgi:hypothetical protein
MQQAKSEHHPERIRVQVAFQDTLEDGASMFQAND